MGTFFIRVRKKGKEMSTSIIILIALLCALAGAGIASVFFILLPKMKKEKATKQAQQIVDEANAKADKILADAKKEGKQTVEELKVAAEKDIKERKASVVQSEQKLDQREASLDKREDAIISREDALDKKKDDLESQQQAVNLKDKKLQEKLDSVMSEIEKIAGLTADEAKEELMKRVEEKEAKRIALYKEQMEEEAQSQVEDKAKNLLGFAMEKYAQEVTSERSTSTITLPSDEMKGRIIGREGRNIKSMEALFGVSLIIDDTPEAITVSCFDPIRREKAKLTLEALIKDGRIQPGRIEDLYTKISNEFDDSLRRIGEQTVFKLGLPRISAGLYPYLGRLKYRTSFGQNVLDHSIQVAYLSSVMASELGLDPIMAKRAGLLHDIVENRLVGMKSRGVYETPGGTILYKAHEMLETITLDKETSHYKALVGHKLGELVYNAQWYSPLTQAILAFVKETQKTVTGDVNVKLYKGNIINAGVTSPFSLYDPEIATFDEDEVYNQADSAGFINLYGLPTKVYSKMKKKAGLN